MSHEQLVSVFGTLALIVYLFLWRLVYLRIRARLMSSLDYSLLITATLSSLTLYAFLMHDLFATYLPGILEMVCLLVTMMGLYLSVPALAATVILGMIRLIRKPRNSRLDNNT